MSMRTVLLTPLLILALVSLPALAEQEPSSDSQLGERLLRQLWADMGTADMEAIEETLAEGFQSVHQYGASNREEEIALIEGLELGDYTLSDIRVTRNGPAMVITYSVAVAETIRGKRLTRSPAARLSVFLETDDGWKWLAHANLKPLN